MLGTCDGMVNMKELDTNNVKWPLKTGADYLVANVDLRCRIART